MTINYKKMWDLVEFCQLNKSEFQKLIDISAPTMSKLSKNEPVSIDIILRICRVLHCDIGDIMEVQEDI